MQNYQAVGNIFGGVDIRKRIEREFELSVLPKEKREKSIDDFLVSIVRRVLIVCISKLPIEEVKKIDDLLEAGDEKGVQQIFLKHIPHFPAFVDEVVEDCFSEIRILFQNNQQQDDTQKI